MSEDFLSKRRGALEASFFRKRDAELVDKLKEEMQADALRKELVAVTGISDDKLLDRLAAMNLGADTVAALSLVPLVRVAWANGTIEDKERQAVLSAAVEAGLPEGSASHRSLVTWLNDEPDSQLVEAWNAYASELCKSMDADDCAALKLGLLSRARQIAEAAGGFLGLGNKVSAAEEKVLDELKTALG